jgi:hypothetical protein
LDCLLLSRWPRRLRRKTTNMVQRRIRNRDECDPTDGNNERAKLVGLIVQVIVEWRHFGAPNGLEVGVAQFA